MKPISERQEIILDFIQNFIEVNDYPPTIRDIQAGCNISSTSVVSYNLDKLKETGYLDRNSEVSRGLKLTKNNSDFGVPLLGTIAAGSPFPLPDNDTWSDLNGQEIIEIPHSMINSPDGVYALKVKGESMIDAFISDGDLVIMEQTSNVRNGQMAAVRIISDDSTTLKHVYSDGEFTKLEPANKQMKPMTFKSNNIQILSKVIGVWRYLG
ncbi:MAG: repressor LexA [Dehalococcoidia bacterium]|nr:repressor LexA [Dehalococcoidia bacterium]